MSSKNSAPEALTDFFRAGKADTDFEVQETYVTGVCTLYPDRLAGPQEYAIRERSVVERAGRPLSVCVQEAKDLAFQSAVRRMESLVSTVKPAAAPAVTPVSAKVKAPQKEKPAPEPEAVPPVSQNGPSPEETAQAPTDSANEPAQIALTPASSPRRLEISNLRPTSSLLPAAPESEQDSEEQEIEKARATKIYCLGRLHECDGWTAGRLLDERPEVIVDMAKQYNGPRVEEKDAFRTLYAEALRRVERVA